MLLIFEKSHPLVLSEEKSHSYQFGQNSKERNKTILTFEYNAAINGRFENKLQRFIDKLPFAYFACRPVLVNGTAQNNNLYFTQGKQTAKEIKHAIIAAQKLDKLHL